MKWLVYDMFCGRVNNGSEEDPKWENIFERIMLSQSEANEEIAKAEAYNGEYEIVDDGEPDPAEIPSQLDRIEAQIAYTAIMTDTLLEV